MLPEVTGKNPSKVPVLVDVETRITEEQRDSLKQLAKLSHRSVAAEVRVAIERHLEDAA